MKKTWICLLALAVTVNGVDMNFEEGQKIDNDLYEALGEEDRSHFEEFTGENDENLAGETVGTEDPEIMNETAGDPDLKADEMQSTTGTNQPEVAQPAEENAGN